MDVSDIMKARLGGLAGHFALSWSLIHWRVWVWLVTGDHTARERVTAIDTLLSHESWCGFLILVPFGLALLFGFIIWPANQFLTAKSEDWGKGARTIGLARSLLTTEEGEALRHQIEVLREEVAEASSPSWPLETALGYAIECIQDSGGSASVPELIDALGGGVKAKTALRTLLSQGRLRYSNNQNHRGYDFLDLPVKLPPN